MNVECEREYSSDWVTWHEADWLRWFAPFIGREGTIGLEIGSYEGRSAVWFCEHVLTGHGSFLTCVDGWWNRDHEDTFRRNTKGLPIYQRRGATGTILPVLAIEGRRYSFVYVDGDHAAARVLADMCAAWDLLSPGGLMVCDDYGWVNPEKPDAINPKPAIDAFLTCFADRIARYEIATKHCQVAIWKPN
jgi:predicted O-methyltransferase YrrM